MNTQMNTIIGVKPLVAALAQECAAENAVVVESVPGLGKSEVSQALVTMDGFAHMPVGFDPAKVAPTGRKAVELRVGLYENYDFPGPLWVGKDDVLRTHLHPTLDQLSYGDVMLIEELKLLGANKVAMMLLEGRRPRVGHWTGPEHVFRIGLANGSDDGALECLDNPVVGNRHSHIRWMGPTAAEWCQWARVNGVDPTIMTAVHMEGESLMVDYNTSRMRNATPRSWFNASRSMLALDRICEADGVAPTHAQRTETLARWVNDEAALKVAAIFHLRDKLVPFSAVVAQPSTCPLPDDPASTMMLAGTLGNRTDDMTWTPVMQYAERLPLEVQGAVVDPIIKRHPALAATPEYRGYDERTADLRVS